MKSLKWCLRFGFLRCVQCQFRTIESEFELRIYRGQTPYCAHFSHSLFLWTHFGNNNITFCHQVSLWFSVSQRCVIESCFPKCGDILLKLTLVKQNYVYIYCIILRVFMLAIRLFSFSFYSHYLRTIGVLHSHSSNCVQRIHIMFFFSLSIHTKQKSKCK